MIVDVHSHAWPGAGAFSESFVAQAARMRARPLELVTDYARYRSTAGECEATVVFGGKARLAGLWVDDEEVAAYARQDPARLFGFLSVDPTQPGWQAEMRDGHERLGLVGIKLLPMYAGFMPQDAQLNPLWEYACRRGLPVLLHTGTTFLAQALLGCTLPRHIDAVARRFPEARIVMAHLGHPYEAECIAVVRKHPHVYADISALHYRPWQMFHSLMLALEYGVWDKLLFGSDFPVSTVEESIAGLREVSAIRIDRFSIPWEKMEEILHRDSLRLLGLTKEAAHRLG